MGIPMECAGRDFSGFMKGLSPILGKIKGWDLPTHYDIEGLMIVTVG
jgi:hypothetical protein